MNIPLIKPNLSEEESQAVSAVIRSTWINEGEKVLEFENVMANYIGTKHAVAFFNGTVALHAALLSLGIGPGDEVIVPSFTFFSTVSTVVQVGATPVFADICPRTFGLDPDEVDVSRKISKCTKAIMPVHYGGLAADLDPITDLARNHNLIIIEDAAESLGAEYRGKKVGAFGKVGMFSFTPTKIITMGEGGILTTDDSDVNDKLRMLRNHGQEKPYHHVCFGFNYRMTEMQAALGLSQIKKLPEIIRNKRKVVSKISEGLKDIDGLKIPIEPPDRFHTYMMYTICLKNQRTRDRLCSELGKAGITTRIYFPPVHLQPVFKNCRVHLPITERVASTALSLPCYSSMSDTEIDFLTARIKDILKKQ